MVGLHVIFCPDSREDRTTNVCFVQEESLCASDVEITRIPRTWLLLGQEADQLAMFFPQGISPWEELLSMVPCRHGRPAPAMEIRGVGTKVLSGAHFAIWLKSSPPPILHYSQLATTPTDPVWLTERRRETLCGVVNVCVSPQAEETRSGCQVPITMVFNVTTDGKTDPHSLAPCCA